MYHLLFLLQLSFISIASGLIGYDCGSHQLNVTTVSLKDVDECDLPRETVNITKRYVQLLQINEYTETQIIQCKLELFRTVYVCGMFSHISVVHNGAMEYIMDVNQQACEDMHRYGIYKLGDSHIIRGIRVNHTVPYAVTLAGTVNQNGKCIGQAYSDLYGNWDYVVVQGILKITLTEQTGQINLNSNKIKLSSGTTCAFSDGHCIDASNGYTFWRAVPGDTCKFNKYSILFEGLADKMIDEERENAQTVYSLETDDLTFAFTSKSQESVCGYTIIRTEHPKLVLFETIKGVSFAINRKPTVSNLDLFAYVNSKFVYTEGHLRKQLKNLYYDVISQKCNLEKQTIRNALAIATQSPDEFAFHFMKGPGYMAVVAGEVVHVIKCIPVEVKVEQGNNCYVELQVSRNNQTLFLTPRTHILKETGTKITCNALLPSYYQIGDVWYKILPRPTEAIAPHKIKPLTKPTWKYINPSNLATSGIYTQADLNDLRERIMFPVERSALLNDVAREIHAQPIINREDGTFGRLINEATVSKILKNTWGQLWGQFMSFGTFSAGCISILIILQLLKTIVDVVLKGYALHATFGWSIHILGALWDSITYFLLHIRSPDPTPTSEDIKNQDPESTIPINSDRVALGAIPKVRTENETAKNYLLKET